jgi:glutathione synthase
MEHLFVIDPIEALLPEADTTIAFMREAQQRGHGVFTCGVEALAVGSGGRPRAQVTATSTLPASAGQRWYSLGKSERRWLDGFTVVWMRKDPPLDMGYVHATHLLSLVKPETLVVNNPSALRDANEKLFALRFPELCPETLVTRSIAELLEFLRALGGQMVVKPLDGAGGRGVFVIAPGDLNTHAILEQATDEGRRFTRAVLRVPRDTEARANFHAGGSPARTTLSPRDREICSRVGPALRDLGIVFAGIDVIGDWLTEVNVTSPTGIREIQRLDGTAIERDVLDAVEARVRALRAGSEL